jgi:hypothetical protein
VGRCSLLQGLPCDGGLRQAAQPIDARALEMTPASSRRPSDGLDPHPLLLSSLSSNMSDAIPADTKYTAGDQIEFYDVGKFETSKGEVRRPAKGSPFCRQALQLTCLAVAASHRARSSAQSGSRRLVSSLSAMPVRSDVLLRCAHVADSLRVPPDGRMLSGKLQKDELGYVLINLDSGLPSGSEAACLRFLSRSISEADPASTPIRSARQAFHKVRRLSLGARLVSQPSEDDR